MGRHYDHLSLSERCRLMRMLEQGLPKTEIARRLGRHRSTIHRELKNNSNAEGYRPDGAARLAWAQRMDLPIGWWKICRICTDAGNLAARRRWTLAPFTP